MSTPTTDREAETRRLIVNPTSGQGDHVEHVRRLAGEYGFAVWETDRPGHAIELAEAAADEGVDLLGVCGGDGTVHEVLRGIVAADALKSMTLAILPAGTANIIATDLGITDMQEGFEVAIGGQTRRLDLGMAADEPFLMSAIAGLPAEASAAASAELKERFGTFAFVIEGVKESKRFDGLAVEIDAVDQTDEFVWRGEVLSLLFGNLRGFDGTGQANAEDGLLEVAIVEQMPSIEAIAEAIERRLLAHETGHITTLTATTIEFTGLDETTVTFSLDGEIRRFDEVRISVSPQLLNVRVGESYIPEPEG